MIISYNLNMIVVSVNIPSTLRVKTPESMMKYNVMLKYLPTNKSFFFLCMETKYLFLSWYLTKYMILCPRLGAEYSTFGLGIGTKYNCIVIDS